MPGRVRFALVLLWVAWLVSVCAWIIHLFQLGGLLTDLYAVVGLPAALVQAFLIYLIGSGSNIARLLVVLIAVPAFMLVQLFFFSRFNFSSVRLAVETVLRGTAVIILLTPGSTQWFNRIRIAG